MGASSGVSVGYAYKFPVEVEAFAPNKKQYSESPRAPKYPLSSLNELKGLENWSHTAVNHIFLGEVKLKGNEINFAYANRQKIRNNIIGMSKSGIKIRFNLNKRNQIVSAYPKFE